MEPALSALFPALSNLLSLPPAPAPTLTVPVSVPSSVAPLSFLSPSQPLSLPVSGTAPVPSAAMGMSTGVGVSAGAAWEPSILSSATVQRLEAELEALVQQHEARVPRRTAPTSTASSTGPPRSSGEPRPEQEVTRSVLSAAVAHAAPPTHASAAALSSRNVDPRSLKRDRAAYESDVAAAAPVPLEAQIQAALRNPQLVAQIKEMKRAQVEHEKRSAQRRVHFLEDQERRRHELFKMHEARLKGARSEAEFEALRREQEREFATLEATFRAELLRRDQAVIDDLNKSAKAQQRALTELGVPGFSVTDDPREIAQQMDILRLISDAIERAEGHEPPPHTQSILAHTLLTELQLPHAASPPARPPSPTPPPLLPPSPVMTAVSHSDVSRPHPPRHASAPRYADAHEPPPKRARSHSPERTPLSRGGLGILEAFQPPHLSGGADSRLSAAPPPHAPLRLAPHYTPPPLGLALPPPVPSPPPPSSSVSLSLPLAESIPARPGASTQVTVDIDAAFLEQAQRLIALNPTLNLSELLQLATVSPPAPPIAPLPPLAPPQPPSARPPPHTRFAEPRAHAHSYPHRR